MNQLGALRGSTEFPHLDSHIFAQQVQALLAQLPPQRDASSCALNSMITTSELTCPNCGHVAREVMPTDACIYFYDCPGCAGDFEAEGGRLLRILFVWIRSLPSDAGPRLMLRHESRR